MIYEEYFGFMIVCFVFRLHKSIVSPSSAPKTFCCKYAACKHLVELMHLICLPFSC